MKKKSASQSAFFKLRLLLGVLLCFAAVSSFCLRSLEALGQSGPQSAQPLVRAQYRGVMPVVKFDISPPMRDMKPLPWKGMYAARERGAGADSAGPVGPVVPDTAVQRVLGKIGIPSSDHQLRWEQQSLRLLSAGPERRGRSKSCSDDGQSAFSNLQQEREIALRSGSEQYTLVWIWRGLPDPERRRPCRHLRPIGRSLDANAIHCRGRRSMSVWRFHRQTIRWDLIIVGPSLPEIIFPTIRKLACGRMHIISARENS